MSKPNYKSFCESPEFFLTDEELETLTDSTTGEYAPEELVPVECTTRQIHREFVPVYTSFYSGNESENYYPTTEPFLRFVPVEDLPPEEDNWGIPIPPPLLAWRGTGSTTRSAPMPRTPEHVKLLF